MQKMKGKTEAKKKTEQRSLGPNTIANNQKQGCKARMMIKSILIQSQIVATPQKSIDRNLWMKNLNET